MIDHMLRHLDRWWRRNLDHLSPPCHTDPSQPTGALRTRPYPVFDDARRRFPTPPVIMLRLPLLARLLLTELLVQLGDFFCLRHALSLSKKVHSEQYRIKGAE